MEHYRPTPNMTTHNRQFMYGLIYLFTNTKTDMQYVGQTIQGLDARFNKHVSDTKTGEPSLIANAIQER